MEPTLQYSPSRTRSTRLGAGRVVRPLDSPLHPTIYPLASTKSSRRNNARFTSGEEASVSQEYNRVAKVASPAASGVYETPQFRTFQERKRDKEKQLAAAAGREWRDPEDSRPESFPARIAQTEEYPHGPRILAETPASSSTSSRSASPSWLGRDVGIVLPGVGIPLAPANIAPGSSTTSSKFATRRPLPVPFKQTNTMSGGLSPSENMPLQDAQPMASRPLPTNAYKTKEDPAGSQSGTPDSTAARALTAQNGSRRLPKPKTMSPTFAPFTQRGAHTLSSPTESASATSPINSTTDAILGGLDHGPIWKRDSFARSDTVTSVKSLDRFGLCQSTERPLPTPPVSVGTSRSLDRGPSTILPMQPLRNDHALIESTEQPRDPTQKSSDSTIQDHLDQNYDDGDVGSPPITVPTPVVKAPSRINSASHAVVQVDSPDRASSPMPSYAYSTIPIISVAMVPSHEFDATSSNVPSITLPGDDKASDPASPVGFPEMPIIVIPGDDQPHGRVDTAGTQAMQRSIPGIFCARCDNTIIGRIVSAMDKRWHPECFQCSSCRTLLEHVSSYEHDGKAYCHMDYHDLFAPKCHYCETAIVDSRFITIDDTALGHRYYHELHFFCGECGDPFLDPSKSSSAGTEFNNGTGSMQESDDLTKEFVINGKHAFCVECDVKLHRPKCAGCRKPIRDQAVGAMGVKWHKDCFCCTQCDESFPNGTFFPVEREPFCQECYTSTLRNGR